MPIDRGHHQLRALDVDAPRVEREPRADVDGIGPGGNVVTPDDLDAIVAYLRTVPAVE